MARYWAKRTVNPLAIINEADPGLSLWGTLDPILQLCPAYYRVALYLTLWLPTVTWAGSLSGIRCHDLADWSEERTLISA